MSSLSKPELLKKIGVFGLIIFITPIFAGIYGVIHDQITFSISYEYYSKFKFIQFDTAPALTPRVSAIFVGWAATWWMGIPMGLILGLTGLIHVSWKSMIEAYLKSIPWIILTALLTGIIGLIYGRLFLVNSDLNWYFPPDLVDRKHFIMVGSMHNFSYLGGLTGLIIGIYHQLKFKKKITGANNRYITNGS